MNRNKTLLVTMSSVAAGEPARCRCTRQNLVLTVGELFGVFCICAYRNLRLVSRCPEIVVPFTVLLNTSPCDLLDSENGVEELNARRNDLTSHDTCAYTKTNAFNSSSIDALVNKIEFQKNKTYESEYHNQSFERTSTNRHRQTY